MSAVTAGMSWATRPTAPGHASPDGFTYGMTDPIEELGQTFADFDTMDYDLPDIEELETIFGTAVDNNATSAYDTSEVYAGFDSPTQSSSGIRFHDGLMAPLMLEFPPYEQKFLVSRGCYSLPPSPILKQMMENYFRFVHPALPIIEESEIWPMWNEGQWTLGKVSLLVLRAMIFASIQYLDLHSIDLLGYVDKRSARIECYQLTKYLFDFDRGSDVLSSARAALLLTYYSPHYNLARINTHWLTISARFAKIAGADTFWFEKNKIQALRLKRLWWSLLFRDRIMCLGLRRSLTIDLHSELLHDTRILRPEDFERGKSKVHKISAEAKLLDVLSCTCRLVQALTPAVEVLYGHETLRARVAAIKSGQDVMPLIDHALQSLAEWHWHTVQRFPSPIALGEEEMCVPIFANLLFCYQATAVFALNMLRITVYEVRRPEKKANKTLYSQPTIAMAHAIRSMTDRMNEFIHARLLQYLPISMSAYVALPTVLQAVNCACAKGRADDEKTQLRKLEVLERVLEAQRSNFDGTAFIIGTLEELATAARGEQYVEDTSLQPSDLNGQTVGKSYWPSLIRTHPKPMIRLLYRLDRALCSTTNEGTDDIYPDEVRDLA